MTLNVVLLSFIATVCLVLSGLAVHKHFFGRFCVSLLVQKIYKTY